jgi:hypothetical protein
VLSLHGSSGGAGAVMHFAGIAPARNGQTVTALAPTRSQVRAATVSLKLIPARQARP